MLENTEKFIDAFADSLARETFVKMTLGNYKGEDEHLQKILFRLIRTKKGVRLFALYRGGTRDTVKNYAFDEGTDLIRSLLGTSFFSGHLFTTENDLQLEIGRKQNARLNVAKPTFKSKPPLDHDRAKKQQVDPGSYYLRALGITTDRGEIRDKQQDKWKQINKFIEILSSLYDKSPLKGRESLSIVDMGSGKGYLTFAAYDHFRNVRGLNVTVTGVDTKRELVDLCNEIAAAGDFDGLRFVHGRIDSFDIGDADVLIALHACNTATDDALFKGIAAGAALIVAAPCCHQELRPQIKSPAIFKDILKHGVMMERAAETLTDGLRSLLLERSGYATKLFEFVPTEHTPKNNMIVGTRLSSQPDQQRFDDEIRSVKQLFGIEEQRLEKLLSERQLSRSIGTT